MEFNRDFFETHDFAAGFVPVNMASADNDGDWVNISEYDGIAILFFAAAGTAGQDPTIEVKQAKSGTGTDEKDFLFSRVWVKKATDIKTVGKATLVTRDADEDFTAGDLAEKQKMIGIYVRCDQLDSGFTHIAANVGDVGANSQIGCILYIGCGPRYSYPNLPALAS